MYISMQLRTSRTNCSTKTLRFASFASTKDELLTHIQPIQNKSPRSDHPSGLKSTNYYAWIRQISEAGLCRMRSFVLSTTSGFILRQLPSKYDPKMNDCIGGGGAWATSFPSRTGSMLTTVDNRTRALLHILTKRSGIVVRSIWVVGIRPSKVLLSQPTNLQWDLHFDLCDETCYSMRLESLNKL